MMIAGDETTKALLIGLTHEDLDKLRANSILNQNVTEGPVRSLLIMAAESHRTLRDRCLAASAAAGKECEVSDKDGVLAEEEATPEPETSLVEKLDIDILGELAALVCYHREKHGDAYEKPENVWCLVEDGCAAIARGKSPNPARKGQSGAGVS